MFEWPRTEGPALALELPASEAAAAAAAFSARSIARELSRRTLPTRLLRFAARRRRQVSNSSSFFELAPMPIASISACTVSNSAFSRAYSTLRSSDAMWRAIARGTAREQVTGRPAAPDQGRCLRSAHCPHCVFSPFFSSRGDIDRRAFQRAPPPSATGVREAPPKPSDRGCQSNSK